ncbi:transcriptional regulator, partial [candidate division KSB3 bacterium]|nr:transcriptional regulator [candidate division KSB3 bacterium]MBD3324743.1 transcriptional regulator [candidate division KSB3 bacterium]
YQDFDTTFRLRQHVSSEKFDRVKDLLQGGVPLPPVKLYQIKGDYYVLDGNHRVAAAKALGYEDIEADIIEFLPSAKTLENLLYREKADFMEQTKLPCPLELTEIGQYAYLLKQIQTHQEFLAQAHSAPVSFEQAAADWYETIYQPLLRLIQRGRLLASFPRRTPADLYTYISSHQWQKQQSRQFGKEIDHLIPNDMEEFRATMQTKDEEEYPEMQREITVFVLMNIEARRESRIMEKLFNFREVRELHSVHGNVDLIAKVVLTRDLLASDAETISNYVTRIRQIPGVINTQTLIPGRSMIKDH